MARFLKISESTDGPVGILSSSVIRKRDGVLQLQGQAGEARGAYRPRQQLGLPLLSTKAPVPLTWTERPSQGFLAFTACQYLASRTLHRPFLILPQREAVENVETAGTDRDPSPNAGLVRRSTDQLFFCLCSNCS